MATPESRTVRDDMNSTLKREELACPSGMREFELVARELPLGRMACGASEGQLNADGHRRQQMADWRRPALGTARPKPAIQDVALKVSKVASKSSAGAPALGH